MNGCEWEPIDDFRTIGEFNKFYEWICNCIKEGYASELDVAEYYGDASCRQEKWFLHHETKKKWRLVWPDYGFHGLFEFIE